jgi:hypothetical protein
MVVPSDVPLVVDAVPEVDAALVGPEPASVAAPHWQGS